MTNKQKEDLAFALWSKAGDLIEYWNETCNAVENVSREEARLQIVKWLNKLPGKYYDTRLRN